jgi:hypothetical protein
MVATMVSGSVISLFPQRAPPEAVNTEKSGLEAVPCQVADSTRLRQGIEWPPRPKAARSAISPHPP